MKIKYGFWNLGFQVATVRHCEPCRKHGVAISDKLTQSIYRVANEDTTAMQECFSGCLLLNKNYAC
ncbi:MAG: hypothetical protein IJM09_05715 [Neisseriaceae bacterium]|nr:hypothetical protein [Neisseriaceae bacterium]